MKDYTFSSNLGSQDLLHNSVSRSAGLAGHGFLSFKQLVESLSRSNTHVEFTLNMHLGHGLVQCLKSRFKNTEAKKVSEDAF